MRIWDVEPSCLCRKHLLGEHRELHALWVILTQGKKGYIHHPETKRWINKTAALFSRHEKLVLEMKRRGYNHLSPLDIKLATGDMKQAEYINSISEQIDILRNKNCECPL